LEAWIKGTCTRLQTQLCSTLADKVITKVLEPWATTAFNNAKAQQIILLDQRCKELVCITSEELAKEKEAAHQRTSAKSTAFFEQQLSICTKQSLVDIKAHEAELQEAAEVEISAFKHSLKIEVGKRKDKICASLHPPSISSNTSQPIAHTNKPKRCIDPTARPLPHSRSTSRSRFLPLPPSPETLLPGRSPDMATPCALPAVELMLTHALTEHALSLQPLPMDVSVGPPEGSTEDTMMGVHPSQLTTYKYPPAPSVYKAHGPSNTAVPSLQPQLPPTDPPTSKVMAVIMALSSQVSTLSSQFSSCLEHLENPVQSYSPLEPAALWQPTPSHLPKPARNLQTGLPNLGISSQQVDFTWDMDEVADFEDYNTHQTGDQVSVQEAHTTQREADLAATQMIPSDIHDM